VLAEAPKKSSLDNPMAIVLLAVIVALLIVIVLLGYVLTGTAQYYVKRYKEEQASKSTTAGKTVAVVLFCFAGLSAFAQTAETTVAVKDSSIAGLSEFVFYTLISVIVLELIVILTVAFSLKRLLAKEKPVVAATGAVEELHKESLLKRWWDRANRFRSLKEEATIDTGHDYDNIRELDNRLPPWWLYGFYCTIVFSVIYLWRFEVSHTAPSSIQEFTTEIQKAEAEKEKYLAKAASRVDENTVTMLDGSGIASGRSLFTSSCAPCHGTDGGGSVGPNLTDDYWLHGGSLKDIFKTIKYGVQEKGMKSWKDDFSPVQIAQLTSYIKSLHGNRVTNPKEPQGEIYKEQAAADSTEKIASISQ
jgi:cytochrome c oxidase cbb3-type subunit 3